MALIIFESQAFYFDGIISLRKKHHKLKIIKTRHCIAFLLIIFISLSFAFKAILKENILRATNIKVTKEEYFKSTDAEK
jgi:hypothetical protein